MTDPSPPRTILFTLEEKVRSGCIEEYTEHTKKLIELIRELDPGICFSAFGSDEGQMNYNQRINNPCDIGLKLEAWGKVQETLLETEWGRKRLSTIEWSRYSVWERSAELSYDPLLPDPDPNQLTYYLWKNLRVRAEKEMEFIETGCQVRAFLEKENFRRGYSVFRNRIGYEGPLYTVIFAGRDRDEANGFLKETGRTLGLALLPFLPPNMGSVDQMTDFEGRAVSGLSLPA
jgi:hypothetical protein